MGLRWRPSVSYDAHCPLFSVGWSWGDATRGLLAVSTFVDEYERDHPQDAQHELQVLHVPIDTPASSTSDPTSDRTEAVTCLGRVPYKLPATKVGWIPDFSGMQPHLLATSGDALRIWRVSERSSSSAAVAERAAKDDGFAGADVLDACAADWAPQYDITPHCELSRIKMSGIDAGPGGRGQDAPSTSFDWNETDTSLLGVCSIDTTCSLWDITQQQIRTQLIAHDKEVYDFSFGPGTDLFATCGADGSIRMFDLRDLNRSTVLYENATSTPLLRVAWNSQNPHYIGCVTMRSHKIIIVDIRMPSVPAVTLEQNQCVDLPEVGLARAASHDCVTGIAWAPFADHVLLSAGDSGVASLWDLSDTSQGRPMPALSYNAGRTIHGVQWSPADPNWIALTAGSQLQVIYC
ncbi:DDB1- and CUL4-associated factor 7-like [Porphyridium purpureum]|uniref:DDB1-and CUL4-associated factor 7-like n=1 Tax=Porphyridium purpureum TaxID=35688 RepID=A0A5J4YP00_PORPP|nr:DDB1- and CUL4-associated factor 7-like [Porphyridium purpureum]|eukprot:POR7312..scf249_10